MGWSKNRFFVLIVLLLGLFLLAACGKQAQIAPVEQPESHLAWPPAPLEEKIVWVRNIDVLSDSKQSEGFWGRVKEFFVGREIARILRPYGVATDYGNRLFIADTGASRVHVFGLEEPLYKVIEATDSFSLQSPIGLAYAGDDILYFTDSGSGQIVQCNLADLSLRSFTPTTLQRPTGIAFSWQTKQLFVVDTLAHQVIVFGQTGVEQFRFGGRGRAAGQFNYPTDIWVDMNGQVYVTDALNARIQIFSLDGRFIRSFGQPGDTPGSFAKPKGVTVDGAGHIYVCDALFSAVQIFSQKGQLLMAIGNNGSRAGEFWMPSGIFADRNGYIYVSDTYNRRIQVFRHVNCVMSDDCKR